MSRTKFTLLASTALTVATVTGAANAQSDTANCDGLLERVEALPQELPDDVDWTIEDVRTALETADEESCAIIVSDIDRMMREGDSATDSDSATAEAEAEASDQMRAVERAQTSVTLEDEAVVEGTVFIDREAANVEVTEGQTEIMVSPGQPSVDVTEQAAQITVREQPATIHVEMAQPTIRIEQPAPEIIITMPEPGVDVANAEPQIEVRQAEPRVSVSQASPSVDLELQVAENPDQSRGIEVEDRDTGERFAMGETREMPSEDANVSIARSEPIVRMQESGGESGPRVNISRAEPTVSFERAEPQLNFTQAGEPSIQFATMGEPTVTIRRNGEDGGQTDAAATDGQQGMTGSEQSEMAQAESELEQAGENAEMAAENAGDALESELEETGQDIAAAANDAGRELEEETNEAMAEAERELEGEMRDSETDMAQGTLGGNLPSDMTPIDSANLTFEEFEGMTLFGANGERIGEVSQAVLSDDGLRIDGMVVEVGGFLGLGEHSVQLSLDDVQFVETGFGDPGAYVEMTEEELESMPEWN